MSMDKIEIVDVTARDGLQNEATMFSTEEKLDLIQKAIKSGARRLEVASFAHPKYVPQMADAEAVIAGLPKNTDARFIGLVMNDRGMDRALNTDIEEVGLVCVASDTFAKKNQGQTRDGSVDMACQMIRRAHENGRLANVTIAAAFGCPFEGEIHKAVVVEMAKKLASANPHEISIADTIGVGNPWQVRELVSEIKEVVSGINLRGHFHNTRNTGLANVSAAFDAGVRSIDVSIGGIGGCPFAPAATGNVPSEDVIYMFERASISTGYNLGKVVETAQWLSEKMGKSLPGMVSRAGGFPSPVKAA